MAQGYVRQSAAGIATGLTIQASLFNAEYNQLQNAFDTVIGHTHDGSTGGGAPVPPAGITGLTSGSSGILCANGSNSINARTLTGTAAQIAITNGTGAAGNPTVAIDTGYLGQSSITTLGTIGTGTWQGTLIGATYGGTGVNNGASTITLGGNLVTSGAFSCTLTLTGATNVTLPTSGTLVNTAVTSLSSLATVGTIGTGTWQGAVIGATYGGTGVNNGTNTTTLGGNLNTSGTFTTTGGGLTLTLTGATNVTLPTSGTLVNTAVTSLTSLAAVGTINTGTWLGTNIGVGNGGTGVSSFNTYSVIFSGTTGAGNLRDSGGPGSQGQVLGSNGSTAFPTWQWLTAGRLNMLNNNQCVIAQRGTSGTVTAGTIAYTLDQVMVSCTGANVSWSQGSIYVLPNGNGTSLNYLVINGATGNTDVTVKWRVPGAIAAKMEGQVCVFQVTFTNNTASTITPTLTVKHANALDNWSASTTDVNAVSLSSVGGNGGFNSVGYAFTANSTGCRNGVEFSVDFGAIPNTKSISVVAWDARLAPYIPTGAGTILPPPELRDVDVEQAACDYFFQSFGGINTYIVGAGHCATTTNAQVPFRLRREMRIAPSFSINNVANARLNAGGATNVSTTNVTFASPAVDGCYISATVAAGLTQGNGCMLYLNGSGDSIQATAEL